MFFFLFSSFFFACFRLIHIGAIADVAVVALDFVVATEDNDDAVVAGGGGGVGSVGDGCRRNFRFPYLIFF